MDVMDNPFPRSLGLILFIRTQDYCKALAHCRCSREDYKLHMVQKNLLADLLYGSKPHDRGSEPTHGRYCNPTLTQRSEIRPEISVETLCAKSPLFNVLYQSRAERCTKCFDTVVSCSCILVSGWLQRAPSLNPCTSLDLICWFKQYLIYKSLQSDAPICTCHHCSAEVSFSSFFGIWYFKLSCFGSISLISEHFF